MHRRWIGVAATALAVSAGPAWASGDASGIVGAKDDRPAAKRAAVLTASAWAALAKGDAAMAVEDAEAATLLLPADSGTRLLLGRAYLAAGRFTSAETAFGDALALEPASARAAISRSLAQIALGKVDAARASLAIAEGSAPDADIGLAEALLGEGDAARKRLDAAARAPGADARIRQNLGLVHALAGRWTDAVAVAQQDVPADLMAGRLRRWAMIAQMRSDPAMQVGAILGVLPVADAGQPVALALALQPASPPVARVEAAPLPALAAVPTSPAVALFAPIIRAEGGSIVTQIAHMPPSLDRLVTHPAVMPPLPIPAMAAAAEVAPVSLAALDVPAPAAVIPSQVNAMAGPPRMRAFRNAPARWAEARFPVPKPARPIKPLVTLALAIKPVAPKQVALASQTSLKPVASKTVGSWAVQLGAFSSSRRTEIAWGKLKGKAAFMKAYTPTGSGQRWGKAMIYRLSVSGLPTRKDAVTLCLKIRDVGGSCFVRGVRGDRPMQWAARLRTDQPV